MSVLAAILVVALTAIAVNMYLGSRPSMPSMPAMPTVPNVAGVGGGSSFAPEATPNYNSNAKSNPIAQSSPTYGWDRIRNTAQAGAPVGIVYGTHRVGGQLLNVYKESVGDNQYLNMLIAVSEGEVEDITDIEISGNPISNYYGVWWEKRLGTNDQTPVPYFGNIVTEYSQNAKVAASGFIYTMRGSAIEGFEIFVQFPQGLYAIESREDQVNYMADLQASSLNISDQIGNIQGDINELQEDIVNQQALINERQSWLMILGPGDPLIDQIRRDILDWSNEIQGWSGQINNMSGDIASLQGQQTSLGWQQNDITRTLASSAYIAWSVTYRVEYRLEGETNWILAGDQTVTAATKSVVRRSFKVNGLPPGKYDIRISRTSPDSASFRVIDDIYLTAVDEIIYESLAYPNTALVAVRALATDQLNGSIPTVTSLVKGRRVQTYDGSTWVTQHSNIPAWIVYDLLTSTRYGLGNYIDTTQIDSASMLEAAQWCEDQVDDGSSGLENRCEWDGVLDSQGNAWDMIQQICSTFGGALIYSDGYYKLKISKPASAVQMFTMGNILAGSFGGEYRAIEKQHNAVDVQYADAQQNYAMDLVPIETQAAFQNNEPLRKTSISLIGVVRRSQAIREGNRALNVARLVRRKITFSAAVDAIACEIMDVISFAHDVPQWGYSGRVLRAMGRKVHLDQDVTIQGGKTYALRLRHSDDDTIEEFTVVTGTGTTDWVEVDTDWTVAVKAGDIFSFGELNKVVKEFRITGISMDGDLARKIEAWEYNAGVWSYDNIVVETPNISSLPNPLLPPDPVTDLQLTERLYYNQAGEIRTAIDVWFNRPLETTGLQYTYGHAEVFLSNDAAATWQPQGSVVDKHFTIPDVMEGKTYYVAVVAVSVRGAKRTPAEAPQASLYVEGKSAPPASPANFAGIQQGDTMQLSWDAVDELDVKGYEIREGVTWNAGILVGDNVTGTSLNVPRGINGTYRFWIKCLDTTGNYSDAVSVQVTVSGLGYNALLSTEEMTLHDGTGTGLVYLSEFSGMINPSAVQFDEVPTRTFQDAALVSLPMNDGSATDRIYETLAYDQGRVAQSNITVQMSVDATDPNLTFQTYPSRTFQTYPNDTFQAVTADFTTKLEINLSDDGAAWSGWQTFTIGAYTFRYVKWRLTVSGSVTARILVTSMIETIDVPDVEFIVTGFSVSVGGSNMLYSDYGATFFQTPFVNPIPIAAGFALPVVSNKSATGSKITLYDESGSSIAGTADVKVDGW